FLVRAGILKGLDQVALETIAKADGATETPTIPSTLGQPNIPNYNLVLPLKAADQTDAAYDLLRVAVEEINKDVEETDSVDRVLAYWEAAGMALDPAD